MTDEEQAHDLIQRAKDEFGQADILINSAGVMQLSKIERPLRRVAHDCRREDVGSRQTKTPALHFLALLNEEAPEATLMLDSS